jgi:hypothetical protein
MGLDLAAIAKSATATAMELAGTAKASATFKSGGTTDVDFATDTAVTTGGVSTPIEGILYQLKQRQGNDATGWQTEFLVETAKLPAGISEEQTVVINGATWNIVNIQRIPTDAVTIFGLRK